MKITKLHKITPRLKVKSVLKTVQFYQDVLDFEIVYLIPTDNLTLEFNTKEDLAYHSAVISYNMVDFILERSSLISLCIEKFFGCKISFLIQVEELETLYLKLLRKEVDFIKHLTTTYYGLREIHIKDCNGYELIFREQL